LLKISPHIDSRVKIIDNERPGASPCRPYKNGTVFKFIDNSTVSVAYIKSNENAYFMISFFININIW
jgi:hypothetical protein